MLNNFVASRDRSGLLAEQLVYGKVVSSAFSKRKDLKTSTFRTRGGVEVDFIFEIENDVFAIEVKSTDKLIDDDVAHIRYFQKHYSTKCKSFLFHAWIKQITQDFWNMVFAMARGLARARPLGLALVLSISVSVL